MTIWIILLAILAALLLSVGQLLFKKHTSVITHVSVAGIFKSPWALSGILLYLMYFGVLFLAYDLGGKISTVFPATSLSFLFVPLLGWFVARERFGRRVLLGALLIIAGCVLITR